MGTHALAADIGGTNIRVALFDREGRISHRRSVLTEASQGKDAALERLADAMEAVKALAEPDTLVGAGVSLAGPTDPDTGVMYDPPNLPGWDGFSPVPVLEERLSLSVAAANDASLGALAEHRYGAGRGHRHIIYMTVSTGIGGGIVVDGELYTGSRGFAGEIGHISIASDGPRCNCGNAGCLEVMASGTAVARIAQERLAAGEASTLLDDAQGDLSRVDAPMVAEGAKAGDELARSIMDQVATNLGVGLVSLLHIFDPDVIAIGGGMSQNLELLLPGIAAEIDRHAMSQHRGRMPVVKTELGDDVSLLGAATLAFTTFGGTSD